MGIKPKKVPMRMCLGCREMRPKAELRRIVKSPEGEIGIDLKGKAPGRGAYICLSEQCLKKARKSTGISTRIARLRAREGMTSRIAHSIAAMR